MTVLWTAEDFSAAIVPDFQPAALDDVTGISIDSRSIGPGDAFFAIKGDRFDGHAFAQAALDAGAVVVVLESAKRADFDHLHERVVFVDDVLSGLERLGCAARARMSGRVVAITGSVGKTSTKDALRVALAPSGKVHAAVSSFNNHWGVPLTLARMPQNTDYGVFEIGMNHPGEIRNLVAMVRPHLVVITTVVAAHIGNFSSIEEIAAAKAEIFEAVEPDGAVLINADNEFADFLYERAQANNVRSIYRFGQTDGADIRLEGFDLKADGSDLSISLFGEAVHCHLAAPGRHLAQNALALLGLVKLAGADVAAACDSLATHEASKGRGQRHELILSDGKANLIDESYNANPSSVEAALQAVGLFESQGGRRIVALGDMLELGDDSAHLHRSLATAIEAAGIDRVYLSGPEMLHLWEVLPPVIRGSYAASSMDLVDPLKSELRDGDVVMIKGSLGSLMGPVVAALLEQF